MEISKFDWKQSLCTMNGKGISMNPEIKEKWIARLRSGEYKQGVEALKRVEDYGGITETRHCCLGVLCELAIDEGLSISVGTLDNWTDTFFFDDDYEVLPESVQKWAGINNKLGSTGGFIEYDNQTFLNLADANDKGLTFKEIADIIEREL